MFRTSSTTTRDRNLQFRGAVSTGGSPLDSFAFSPVFMCNLVRRAPQNLEKVAKNPVDKIASNPVTSVAVVVFSALKCTETDRKHVFEKRGLPLPCSGSFPCRTLLAITWTPYRSHSGPKARSPPKSLSKARKPWSENRELRSWQRRGLSRQVSRGAWKRRINRELEARMAHKPWIREGPNREVQTVN